MIGVNDSGIEFKKGSAILDSGPILLSTDNLCSIPPYLIGGIANSYVQVMAQSAPTGVHLSEYSVNGSRLTPKSVYRISLKCSVQTSGDRM